MRGVFAARNDRLSRAAGRNSHAARALRDPCGQANKWPQVRETEERRGRNDVHRSSVETATKAMRAPHETVSPTGLVASPDCTACMFVMTAYSMLCALDPMVTVDPCI